MSFLTSSLRASRLPSISYTRPVRSAVCPRRRLATTAVLRAEPEASTSGGNTAAEVKAPEASQTSQDTPTSEADPPKEEKDVLPFLGRPLGLKYPPTTVRKTWTEEMMDEETRKDHREKLLRAATKGYFSDINATRRHGGKTWIAPKSLIREDKALYFPDIEGSPLNGSGKIHSTRILLGKISLVQMLSSKISELQTEMFCKPTHEAFQNNPHYQLIQINLQENLLKSLLVNLFSRNIRKSIPAEQWGKYLISSQNMDYVRDNLGMTNHHLGYVYLLDTQCRVRWAGCADPMPAEVEALKVCTEVLLNRLKRKA